MPLDKLRIVNIRNTLSLELILASEAFEKAVFQKDNIDILDHNVTLRFDDEGNLISPWRNSDIQPD